jgi:hypothetical protein
MDCIVTMNRIRLNCSTLHYCIAMLTVASSCGWQRAAAEQSSPDKPVFQVDVANPTRDKPQSKLWFAHDSWWAWLPTRQGSGVWRRTTGGWQRQTDLDQSLVGLPRRADVRAEGDNVRAVLVDGRRLAVVALRYSAEHSTYRLIGQPVRFQVGNEEMNGEIETATIARDGHDRWWIAYPWQRRMWVRSSRDASGCEWTEPIPIGREAAEDDLCAIVSLPDVVGLVWSDQGREAMYFCPHKNGADSTAWGPIEEIDSGDKTADDHVHCAVGSNGTLYLATKNSVDRVGQAQLVLRVRHPDGRWENLPYAERTATAEPSRPIVLFADNPVRLFLLHTLYGRGTMDRQMNRIVWQSAPIRSLTASVLNTKGRPLIGPVAGINNVTGAKMTYPSREPVVVLASDPQGRIYEGRIFRGGQH